MACFYTDAKSIQYLREWRHARSGCFAGHRNSRAARRLQTALLRVYRPGSYRYRRGLFRQMREWRQENNKETG
jgi:hypothetical protein